MLSLGSVVWENRCQGNRVIRRLLIGDRDHFCVLPHCITQAWLGLTLNEWSSEGRRKDLRTVAKAVIYGQTPAPSEPKGRDLQQLWLACCFLDTIEYMSQRTSYLGMQPVFATLKVSPQSPFGNISEERQVIKERTIWDLFQRIILLVLES